jgi:hypothetical protein
MELKNLVLDWKTAWVNFPGLPGFEVEVANLSRKELINLRKKCTYQKFNRKTHTAEDKLDDEKFVKEFTKATVRNWKGLTLDNLQNLILIDTEGKDMEEELPYTAENAEILVNSSSEFDQWLNEVVFDISNFRD